MNAYRLQRLQNCLLAALVLCLLLVLYMTFIGIPTSNPKWNAGLAERQIQEAATMQDLQAELRDAVHNLTYGLHLKNKLLLAFLVSTVVLSGFLGWSLLIIRRLKGKEAIDSAG